MAQFEIKDGVAIIPEETKIIPCEAFEDCTSLISIVIPNSVTNIKAKAFKDSINLGVITKTSNVTFIGEEAFANSQIRDFDFNDDEYKYTRTDMDGSITTDFEIDKAKLKLKDTTSSDKELSNKTIIKKRKIQINIQQSPLTSFPNYDLLP